MRNQASMLRITNLEKICKKYLCVFIEQKFMQISIKIKEDVDSMISDLTDIIHVMKKIPIDKSVSRNLMMK